MSTRKVSHGALFGLCGILRVYRVDPHVGRLLSGREMVRACAEGDARLVEETHNLVVDIGMQAIAKFLGGNAGAPLVGGSTFSSLEDLVIATMELGDTPTPPSPANGDTAGVGALVYTPPVTFTYPTPFSLMVSGVLPITEANGLTITEEALKLANGKLFAKTTFSELKTNAYALQFDHTITWSRI